MVIIKELTERGRKKKLIINEGRTKKGTQIKKERKVIERPNTIAKAVHTSFKTNKLHVSTSFTYSYLYSIHLPHMVGGCKFQVLPLHNI